VLRSPLSIRGYKRFDPHYHEDKPPGDHDEDMELEMDEVGP
jgi:hypothetical protein